jgi:hypothetical protein
MAAGRPRKLARKTTGLQKYHSKAQKTSTGSSPISGEESDEGWHPNVYFDSSKLIIGADCDSDAETDEEEIHEWVDFEEEELERCMLDMAKAEGDDPADEEWLPSKVKKKRKIENAPGVC